MIDYIAFQNNLKSDIEQLKKGYETLQDIGSVKVGETPKELVWQQDKVKMYRFNRSKTAKTDIPVLVSFAMMNRQDVLDLQSDRSLIAKLLEEGLDVYLMDWGYPTRNDRFLTMADYILGYWDDAIDYLRDEHNKEKVHMVSICQAGTFSSMYASLRPEKVQTLTTLVAPFDFDVKGGMLFTWAKDIDVDAFVDAYGIIPSSLLDTSFAMLHPSLDIRKYFGIMQKLDDKPSIENFLRMEKWKADTPDLSGEMYRQYIKDLFQKNKLIKGEFELEGEKVDLKNLTMPFLNIYAEHDDIIPNESTINIMEYVGSKDKELYKFPGGHIGVFVGSRSQKELAPSIGKFILDRS